MMLFLFDHSFILHFIPFDSKKTRKCFLVVCGAFKDELHEKMEMKEQV